MTPVLSLLFRVPILGLFSSCSVWALLPKYIVHAHRNRSKLGNKWLVCLLFAGSFLVCFLLQVFPLYFSMLGTKGHNSVAVLSPQPWSMREKGWVAAVKTPEKAVILIALNFVTHVDDPRRLKLLHPKINIHYASAWLL